MDPDKALDQIRALCERFDRESTYEDMDQLVELVQGLDEWLSAPKHGIWPAAWSRPY